MRWLFLLALLFATPAWSQATVVPTCGGLNLTAGTPHNVTVDINGQSCRVGGGGGGTTGCSQATAYLARATGEVTHAADLTTLICGLVTDGVWAKLDALYVLAQQTQADAQLNLVGTSYPLTLAGLLRTATFTSYQGFVGVGASFLNTGFNPTTATGPNYVQNSANFGAWSYLVSTGNATTLMKTSAAPNSNLYDSYPGLGVLARVNNSSVGGVATTISKGLFAGDRPDASNVYPYQNGVSAGPLAFASVALDNDTFIIGSGNTAETISAAHIGASLGSAGNLALYNRLRTYMTSVGVP